MITWWMKLGGTRPPGDNPLLLSISGTGSVIYPVAQTRLDIPMGRREIPGDVSGHVVVLLWHMVTVHVTVNSVLGADFIRLLHGSLYSTSAVGKMENLYMWVQGWQIGMQVAVLRPAMLGSDYHIKQRTHSEAEAFWDIPAPLMDRICQEWWRGGKSREHRGKNSHKSL